MAIEHLTEDDREMLRYWLQAIVRCPFLNDQDFYSVAGCARRYAEEYVKLSWEDLEGRYHRAFVIHVLAALDAWTETPSAAIPVNEVRIREWFGADRDAVVRIQQKWDQRASFTEADWQKCRNPGVILYYLDDQISKRKLHLFAAARCRRVWEQLTDERSRYAVEVVERYADGQAGVQELKLAREGAEAALENWFVYNAATFAARACELEAGYAARSVCPDEDYKGFEEQCDETLPLLLDITGNPFRPVVVEPGWLTRDVVALARCFYDQRADELLPLLADALEEAGTAGELVEHLRGPGPHVRGCFVVDLCLGLS